jgi:hypothetical protein
VLSDGDNTSNGDAGGLTAGPQTAHGSNGSAQVGSPTVFAPARVLSGGTPTPGDDPDTPDTGDVAADLLDTLLGSPSEGGGDLVACRRRRRPPTRPATRPHPGRCAGWSTAPTRARPSGSSRAAQAPLRARTRSRRWTCRPPACP